LGVYSNSSSKPSNLLAQCTINSPTAGAWNSCTLTSGPTLTSGTTYWAGILSTNGTLYLADVQGSGGTIYGQGATSMPSTWTSNTTYTGYSNLSFQALGAGGTPLYLAADVNGDGLTDMLDVHSDSDGVHVDVQPWISTGTAFASGPVDNSMTYNTNSKFVVGDFNGDGKSDFAYLLPSGSKWQRTLRLSAGAAFTTQASDTNMPYQSSYNDRYFAMDVNGDGKSDMVEVSYDTTSGDYRLYPWLFSPNGNASFVAGTVKLLEAYNSTTQFFPGDVNGDGLTDIIGIHPSGSSWGREVVTITGPGPTDLLTGITEPSGGTLSISYKPSSVWSNANNPPLLETVSSVAYADGRGWSATTNYSYSGGLFDWSTRRFQSFQTVTTTEPCLAGESSCPYTVETFDQPANCGSQSPLLATANYDGSGNLYSQAQTNVTYSCSAAPFTGLATGEWEYTYQPGSPSVYKRTYESRAYDACTQLLRL
jgi:hypothetical protein